MKLRVVVSLFLGVLLLTACGNTRSRADQDKDAKLLASSLQSAENAGMGFNLTQALVLTGGQIPSGRQFEADATVTGGALKDGSARLTYHLQQGQQGAIYDMRLVGEQLFVSRHGGSGWKTIPLGDAVSLFPALRLDLVRETTLLATSVSSGALTHIDAGFSKKYAVTPASDQLEQLESVSVEGQTEDAFLKTASGEVDVYLVQPGNQLGRVQVHVTGTDPGSGTKQDVQSTLDLHATKVATISAPANAQSVDPTQILT